MLRDCSRAITINSKSQKAFYRSSGALVALERYDEAINCCDVCLHHFPENSSVKTLREKAVQLRDAKLAKEREKAAKELKEKQEKRQISAAFKVSA